eukprot:m.26210 g.26210  ORF g.26210 m.26210 type:complete len:673 (+) comp8806_c0_seq2:268-2286(+)
MSLSGRYYLVEAPTGESSTDDPPSYSSQNSNPFSQAMAQADASRASSARHRRTPSIHSRASVASGAEADGTSSSVRSLPVPPRRHQRSTSDVSAMSSFSVSSLMAQQQQDTVLPTLFVKPVPSNLICPVCTNPFQDPIIAHCGHTFCRNCLAMKDVECKSHPTVNLKAGPSIPNIAVSEQLSEMEIFCRYGVKPHPTEPGKYVRDPRGCQEIVVYGQRRHHEASCRCARIQCPNSGCLTLVLASDMEHHMQHCQHHSCPNIGRGCQFKGSRADVSHHVKTGCTYQDAKSLSLNSEERQRLRLESTSSLSRESTDMAGLKQHVGALTQKVHKLESALVQAQNQVAKLEFDKAQMQKMLLDHSRQIAALHGSLTSGLMGGGHKYRCQGTLVGHENSVWALASSGDLLFSGSADETIKVWDISHNFTCRSTLNAHRGIVHCLVVQGTQLFSGSQDTEIKVWDVEQLSLTDTLKGHKRPVCTLSATDELLFSGSHMSIMIWDIRTHRLLTELNTLNHWVRAMVCTDTYFIAGAYQTISIWPKSRDGFDVKTGKVAQRHKVLQTQGGSVYSLCVSKNFIFAGTYEHQIHVWDIETYDDFTMLQGHEGIVYDVQVMPSVNGRGKLFSASYDKTIRVWDLDTFDCIQVLSRHEHSVDCLVIDGSRIFSGGADAQIKVWQ